MNFRELRNRLISSLWDYIGCPVILSNQVQPEAEPPFCIYTVTAPYIPDGGMGDYEIADVAEGVKISRLEMPSATFSFTFCSQNRTAENGSAVNGEDEAWAVADKAIDIPPFHQFGVGERSSGAAGSAAILRQIIPSRI